MPETLKHCPFCGHNALIVKDEYSRFFVKCNYCHAAILPSPDKDTAINTWNLRTNNEDTLFESFKNAVKDLKQAVLELSKAIKEETI